MTNVNGGPISQLSESVERLRALIETADDATLSAQSACADWSVAQVLAHLGAGAEIALAGLIAGLDGSDEPVAGESMQTIWDTYDALDDRAALERAIAADRSLVEAFAQLTDAQLADVRVPFFTGPIPVEIFAAFRLSEHAVHTWDIETANQPEGELEPTAAATILDNVVMALFARLAQPLEIAASTVSVQLVDSGRELTMRLGEPVGLTARSANDACDGAMTTTTAAFVRLIYGRSGPGIGPSSTQVTGPVTMETIRTAFPGF